MQVEAHDPVGMPLKDPREIGGPEPDDGQHQKTGEVVRRFFEPNSGGERGHDDQE